MNEKQFTIIWVVALVIIILAGSGSIYYLQFDVLVEKKKILSDVKVQVSDATAKKNKIPGLIKEIEKETKKAEELATRIPMMDRAEYDVFAELLDDLRRKAGVTIPRTAWTTAGRPAPAPGKPGIPATVHKVQYDLTVTGSFYQLLRYVNLIEQQRRFIGVENFTIGKGGGETLGSKAAPRRDMKITIYSYTYKPTPVPFVIEAEVERSGKSTDIPD